MKKKLTMILLAAVVCISMAACSSGSSDSTESPAPTESAATDAAATDAAATDAVPSEAAADDTNAATDADTTYTIGVTFMTLNSPFFEAMERGLKEEAAANNVTVEVSDAQLNVATQISSVENLIAKGVDCILLNAVDSAAIVPAVEAANAAGIPVICLDVMAEGGQIEAFIASNNKAAGVMGGEYIGELLGGTGKVVILDGPPISSFQDRAAGFEEALAKYEGIEIVQHINAVENSTTGFVSAADNILSAYPDLDAVLAVNDFGAIAVESAVKSAAGEFNVVSVGVDGMPDAVTAIVDGSVVAASVAQQPAEMGRLGVQTALKILKGETVEANIDVPLKLLTKDNAAGFTW